MNRVMEQVLKFKYDVGDILINGKRVYDGCLGSRSIKDVVSDDLTDEDPDFKKNMMKESDFTCKVATSTVNIGGYECAVCAIPEAKQTLMKHGLTRKVAMFE